MTMIRRSSISLCLPLLLSALVGCSDPPEVGSASQVITDAKHGNPRGAANFHWLPVIVANPSYSGTSRWTRSLVVQIDQINPATGAVIRPIATFTRGGERRRRIRVGWKRQWYVAKWRTAYDNLDPNQTYRIRVLLDGRELGIADVDVVDWPSSCATSRPTTSSV